ncbi:MAG: septum formation protein, partial [Bradymonadia bacterium]
MGSQPGARCTSVPFLTRDVRQRTVSRGVCPTWSYVQRILLASGSPRRLELLRQVGFAPTVKTASIEEVADTTLPSEDWVKVIAEKKAAAARGLLGDLPLGLTADTTVWFGDGQRLEKPADADGAAAMLRVLSGQKHYVSTGV